MIPDSLGERRRLRDDATVICRRPRMAVVDGWLHFYSVFYFAYILLLHIFLLHMLLQMLLLYMLLLQLLMMIILKSPYIDFVFELLTVVGGAVPSMAKAAVVDATAAATAAATVAVAAIVAA